MSLLKIVHYPDPVLLTIGKPFGEEEFNEDLRKLVEDMFETMYDAQGVGLAAPQDIYIRIKSDIRRQIIKIKIT